MKSLRDIKILMKNSLMSPDIKYQIAHAEKNFIDIELDEDESSTSYISDNEQIEDKITEMDPISSTRKLIKSKTENEQQP
jgi:hypothetical protein